MFAALLVLAPAVAQDLPLNQSWYEVRMGEPVPLSAPGDTLDFLTQAKTRSVRIDGATTAGLTLGPDRSRRIALAASPLIKPGRYNVTVSAASARGETRQASMIVAVDALTAVPSSATRNPVVLLNGWETGFTGACPISANSSETFGNLAQYLLNDGVPVVYFFDNCAIDPNATIEQLGDDLSSFLASIKYDNGAQVPQIDVVGFSMGGLIVRSYLAGLQPSEILTPPAKPLIGKLVLIATPNFGSFVAGNYANLLFASGQDAEMIPGSSLLWNLANWNQRTDDLRGVNAIAVIGNAGQYVPSLASSVAFNNASDGLVSLTSASAGFVAEQASVTRIVPYCHVDPVAFTNISFGAYLCNAPGIANVTSASHETGEIVRSFLGGTTDWQSIGSSPSNDPYLSKFGGMFFGMVNEAGAYVSDLSQVTWGAQALTAGGDLNTIFYADFIANSGIFEAQSASLGTVDCETYTQSPGYFSAVRCKIEAVIFSIGPMLSQFPRIVSSGGNITINGDYFGSQCGGCKVTALAAGASTPQTLQIVSWKNTAITAALPSSFTGYVTITVYTTNGTDNLGIMTAVSSAPAIAVSPSSLQFSASAGGAAPAAQSIQITNSASGTLNWTATASSNTSWLTLSPASGAAPSTLTVSVSPDGLSAGVYTSMIQISASGASNTPQSIAVTFTVTASPPSLDVAPQALTFAYTIPSPAPAAQTVSINNAGGGALAWTASAADSWIALSAGSGTAPATLSVSINRRSLVAGTYTSSIQITAAGAAGSPVSIAVTLVVTGSEDRQHFPRPRRPGPP